MNEPFKRYEKKYLFTAKLEGQKSWKFYFGPNWFDQVDYQGKFKLFYLSVARVKKFKFAQVNHEFEPMHYRFYTLDSVQ